MATHPSSQAPGAAEFSLIPQGEFAAKPPIRIIKPVVLVGSDEHCHLHLVSSSVSRHHALIIREDDRIYVCDLGSRTKILVNGKEQRDIELADGDIVRIGKFSFKFSATRPPAKKARRAGPARLIVDGQAVPTPEGARLILIGRTSGSDVTLVEESVSARHAVIFEVAGKRYVRDLDSRTGTFLNGKKTHQHEIRLEDDLRVGETTLKLTEATEADVEAAAAPAAADEEPLPVSDEVELVPATAEEEPIPLSVETVEPSEAEAEPAMPVAQLPLDDPLPFSEPLPVDLEPELPAHDEVELAPEPVAAKVVRPEEPLELEPEFPAHEVENVALAPTALADHSDAEVPLKFEPETTPEMEDVALAALAPSGDANDDTHIDLEPVAAEAEPETVEPPAPVVQATIPADIPIEPPEVEAAQELDLSDAPEPEVAPEIELAPAATEAEPEPVELPKPVVQATIPADISVETPEVEADHSLDLSDIPNVEPQLEIEPEPEAIEAEAELVEPAAPVVNTPIPADISEPVSEVEPDHAIDLSDAPEPEPVAEAETAPSSTVDAPTELDLLAEFATKPAEEFKPVDFEEEPLPAAEPQEKPPVSADGASDLSDAPALVEIEPESVSEPAEPTPIPSTATINLGDLPEAAESEPEQVREPDRIEESAISSETLDLSDAPSPAEPEPQPIEPGADDSAATTDLSDAPSLLEPEPRPVAEVIEQTAVVSAAAVDLSDAPDAPVELEPSSPPAIQESSAADSSTTVDLDVEPTPSEPEPEQTPMNLDPPPAAEEAAPATSPEAAEIPVDLEPRKTSRGRKRQAPAEPKPPKVRKSRAKRIAPKTEEEEAAEVLEPTVLAAIETPVVETPAVEAPPADEASLESLAIEVPALESSVVEEAPLTESPVVGSTVTESVEIEPSTIEPPAIDVPELAIDLATDLTPDSSLSVSEPVSTEGTLTAPADAVPAEEVDTTAPVDEPSVEPIAPPPAPPPPARPFMSVGDFAYLTGGTVNLDHSLGGMPVRLPDLPPAPTGFGQVRVNLSGKASSPFSSFAKSEPLVFDEPDETAPPLSSQPKEFAQPESIVAEPIVPPPAPVEAQLETVVTPAPAPHDPPPQITITPPPPQSPPPPQPAPKVASPIPRGPRLYATARRESPVKSARTLRPAAETFSQPSNAFDGLAPAVREADAFSNIDAVALNDAAFGGARLSRSDDHNVPESPEAAARIANGPEYDFAEDEFWNRSDEDEGAAPANIPAAKPGSAARPISMARSVTPPATAAPIPAVARITPTAPTPAPVIAPPVVTAPPVAPIRQASPIEEPEVSAPLPEPEISLEAAEPAMTIPAEATEVEAFDPDALLAEALPPDDEPLPDSLPPDAFSPNASPDDALPAAELLAGEVSPDALPPEVMPSDSGEESGRADNLTMESLATTASHSDNSSEAPAAPPPRKRRRFRIPFLMPILLVAMALALGAIWRFTPVQSQIVGKITFDNYNWTAGTHDGTEFEASQRRLLDSDQTHRNAIEFLGRDHPDVPAGFLQVPDSMGRVASSFSLSSNRDAAPAQTVLQLSYAGRNKDDDRLRMMALLQSLVDANAPILDSNRGLHNAEQQAQQAVDAAQKKRDDIKSQLADLQTTIDAQPPADEMAKLASRKAELEKARDDAEEAINRDNNELARVKVAAPEAITAAATMPADPADSQLRQMRQQLADLSAELDSAHSDQLAAATLARQHLETTAKQFNDQLATADEVLGSSSQLRQFVTSARDSQAKARELINILIVDGEDLEKQLEDTRRDVEDLIQARQELKWADDPQLQQFRENLDSAQHRYNANVGDGNKDPRVLDPLQKEIDKWTVAVKAREQQLGVDSSEIKVEEGLNNLVESLRSKLQREKQLVGQILDPLEKKLNDLDPVVAGMPQADQDLAKQLRLRLAALNDARQKYAEAVGEGQVSPSVKVTDLQKQIADLKDKVDRREKDLTQQTVKSRDVAHVQNISKLTAALNADQKNLDAAGSAYGQIVSVFDEKQAEHRKAEAAQQRKINLLDAQRAASTEFEAAQRDRDEKQAAAEHAFDIRPLTDADVIAAAPADPRMMYSLLVLGAGVVLLAGLTFVSHSAAHRAHQLGASGHHHEPPRIAEQIDSMVLPMASDPPSGQ